MLCPSCGAENEPTLEACFTCGTPFPSPANLSQGSLVASRYEILRLLGKGGMGMVFLAHDRVLDEVVALKTLRPDVAREPDVARRFLSEIKLARRVRHENVCGIHEYGEDAGLRFIAMEYIEGIDLRRVLRERGRLPPMEGLEVVIQVAQGLHAIHEAGIIHRDLKTPNIMRDAKGVVRLMDFGIAKHAEADVTLGGQVLGTPEYMSPEQARGEKVTFRTDIYALGIVIYEIFTGHVPFHGDTPVATILKQLHEPPPLDGADATNIPAEVIPVLRRALAKNPADRPSSAHEMVEVLQAAREDYIVRGGVALAPRWPAELGHAALADLPTSVIEDQQTGTQPGTPAPAPDSLRPSTRDGATMVMPEVAPGPADAVGGESGSRASPREAVWWVGGLAIVVLGVVVAIFRGGGPSRETVTASLSPSPTVPVTTPEPSPSPTATAPPSLEPPRPSPSRSPTRPPSAAPGDAKASDRVVDRSGSSPNPAGPTASPNLETALTPVPPPPPPIDPTPSPVETPSPPRRDPAPELPRLDPPRPDPRNRPATYPREQHPDGAERSVYLKIVLSEQGVVTDVNVISGAEPFATAAVEAAWAWRFSPPTANGRPSSGFIVLRVLVRPDKS